MSVSERPVEGYNRVAAILHWLIAAGMSLQVCVGWYMNKAMVDHSTAQTAVEGFHISFGLTILLLILARFGWRLTHRPPPLPAGMPTWEIGLAYASHILFYLLMLAMPLTGWTLVSLGAHPISFWSLPWPHLPGVAQIFGATPPRTIRHQIADIHTDYLVRLFLANLALHVAGAVKHQFDGRPVLWRMTGGRPPASF